MEGIIGDRVQQCSDGHYFTSRESTRLFLSLHLGAKRFMRCPVDHRWRMVGNVSSRDLTEEQLDQARTHRA
jgi:predicted HD phosphohydrolase